MRYDEPLFRPPSEANSLIFQVTIGCSWNKCAFCEMYTSKKFRVKDEKEVVQEIIEAGKMAPATRKIFMADGNAMVLITSKLLRILNTIQENFQKVVRISAYAGSRDLENKSLEELQQLKEAGLKLLYVGIESGDDDLLGRIDKGESAAIMAENLQKAKAAGIKLSVMILNGLGGKKYSNQHALQSAKLISAIQPDYLSTLVLSFPFGVEHYKKRFRGEYEEMDQYELLQELYDFLKATQLESVVFRSDHASNYLALKGILGRDRERLLKMISTAVNSPENVSLRQEWQRGL